MTESELVQIFNFAFEQAWSNLQWWASISVGLIALASIAAKKLSLAMVAGISILYVLFTVYSLINIELMSANVAGGALSELFQLRDSGNISTVGLNLLEWTQARARLGGVLYRASIFGMFSGTLAYLWYSYRRVSVSRKQAMEETGGAT